MPNQHIQPLVTAVGRAPSVTEALRDVFDRPYPFLLDSAMQIGDLGRYSFIGCDPFAIVSSRGDIISTKTGGSPTHRRGDGLSVLQEILAQYPVDSSALPVPFASGAVGYFSYDLGRQLERLPAMAADDLHLPDYWFGLYDVIIAWDHVEGNCWGISTGFPEQDVTARERRARERLDEIVELLFSPRGPDTSGKGYAASPSLKSNFTAREYATAVSRARQYIIDGDIFEVNISQRFEGELPCSGLDLYHRVRSLTPSPFACYLKTNDAEIISASPERFLRREGDQVESRPIKGTRPRGADPVEDKEFADQLLESEKDVAENVMIVDLVRNDLGRVCRHGSIEVSRLAALESFPTVHHLTSTVRGQLRSGTTITDLIRATFPGGSITGAPKIRAMEIIDEIEPTRRAVYTGSIGYLGFDGNLDLNIAIRTIIASRGRAYFQAGGAVVYDSDPHEEYSETLTKARALADALGIKQRE